MTRRQLLAGLGGAAALSRCGGALSDEPAAGPASENARLGIENVCFLTDEVSEDLDVALAFAREFGIRQVEIRSVYDKYCFLHEPSKLKQIQAKLKQNGIRAALLSTPVMKCIAPGFDVSPKVEDDIRLSELAFPIPHEQQFPRTVEFLEKAIEAARIFETDKIRVFSFWRIVEPARIRNLILDKLSELAAMAAKAGMRLAIENESACNLADCRETMAVVTQAPENVGVIWDVVNGTSTGETPYPDGYRLLDKAKIHHMHLKDVQIDPQNGRRQIVAVGEGVIPYPQVFKQLATDGYQGALSMETHFQIEGSREAASRRSMAGIFKALEAQA